MRLIAQQYSFEPQCIVVPAGMPVTFRGTSTDTIHGFVVGRTNANTMLIPGFVSTFTTTFPKPGEQLMPCHEYCGTGHEAMWARVQVLPAAEFMAKAKPGSGSAVFLARKLVLAHFWVAFVAFLGAIVLGAWQMYIRSPLSAWINNPEHYYRSVTAHGTVMAYVLPTLVAMGFGYAISELALKRPLIGLRWAWAGFGLVIGGTVLAAARWRPARRRCSTPSIRR